MPGGNEIHIIWGVFHHFRIENVYGACLKIELRYWQIAGWRGKRPFPWHPLKPYDIARFALFT